MNIVVTGTSRGIGKEIVSKLSDYNNFTIFSLSRKAPRMEYLNHDLTNNQVIPVSFDLNQLKKPDFKLPFVSKDTKIDILINNAGTLINKSFLEYSTDEIQDIFYTNTIGPALLIQKCIPFLNSEAHIVNIGSMGGFQGSVKFPGLSIYSASKSALGNLSECLAAELSEKNIKVNCLALGAVQTEMLKEAFPGYSAPIQPKDMANYIVDFALNGHKFFNGKIIPVSGSTP